MNMKYDLAAVGGATEDRFFTVDDYVLINNSSDLLRKKLLGFEYGAKVGITSLAAAFGGGAANVSVAAARLGLKSALIGSVGNDERGTAIARNLKANKVDTRGLAITPKEESGLSYILVSPRNEHIVFTYRGANDETKVSAAGLAQVKHSAWTYITSLTGSWKKILNTVFGAANNVAWNPGRQQLAAGYKILKPYLAKTDILIVNRDEALELALSHSRKAKDDMRSLLAVLKSFGPKLVIITNGGHGAEAFDGTNFYFQKAVKVRRPIDTTGVGDAFGATFVAGLKLYRGDIKKALQLAAKNAANVVAVKGAQPGLMKPKK